MKRVGTLRTFTPILILGIILLVSGMVGCSNAKPITTPVTAYVPAISFVNTQVTEMTNAAGTDVSFFVRTTADNPNYVQVHIIYYLDVTPPTNTQQPAYTLAGTYAVSASPEKSYTWPFVASGTHTFYAQLVNASNDKPFDPPVIAKNVITVPDTTTKTPEIRLMSALPSLPVPQYSTSPQPMPPLQVQVTAAAHNFKLNDDAVGKQNVVGEGHFIYYLDVQPPTTAGQPATTKSGSFIATTDDFHLWEGVAAGTHTYSVQLVNNDNTPLNPPVISEITSSIPASL